MPRTRTIFSENSRTFLTGFSKKENKPEKLYQYVAASIATLSASSAIMPLSWTSAAIPILQKDDSHIKISNDQASWLASLMLLASVFGAIPSGGFCSVIGRKKFLMLSVIPLFFSWIIVAFSGCVYALYFARILAGLVFGAVCVAAPMYVAELAHRSIRGTLGTFFQIQVTLGLLLEYVLGGTVTDFKLLALTSSVLPVVFLVCFSFMPESPVYLYSKGKVDEARKSLVLFRGEDYDVEEELTMIAEGINEANLNKVKFTDLIYCKATFKGMIISIGLMLFQQLSGINAVICYAGNIFTETGTSLSPNACAILIGVVQLIATLMSTLLIDRTGRKILLFISASVMAICHTLLGAYFYFKQYQCLSFLESLPVISLAIFISMFSIGFGPIPWLITSEIFTSKTKGLASSISVACNGFLAFIVTKQFQIMITSVGIGTTFGIFAVICLVGAIFVAFIVPETKGKSIDEIQDLLKGNMKSKSGTGKPENITTFV